jgi:plasmid maintenance system killer protein
VAFSSRKRHIARPSKLHVNGRTAVKGDLKGHWPVSVGGNWRLTFTFEGEDAILVDYLDYH